MEDNEKVLEFDNSAIGCSGAKCIAAAIPFFDSLVEVSMSNCEIRDEGANSLFDELKNSNSVTQIDLSQNNLTEKCFMSLATLL
jgi:Ran GTPase-activating protein (RanGAP) involved in mRNA processing and transport